MRFSDWLKVKEQNTQETSTSTGDIAHFARPFLTGGERMYPHPLTVDDLEKKKKKKIRELADLHSEAYRKGDKEMTRHYQKQLKELGFHFFS